MAKTPMLLAALVLAAAPAFAENEHNDAGFTNPLSTLQFNPDLDQQEFERATYQALQIYDPFEPFNRTIYAFNYRFDQWVFLPVVSGYRYVTPELVQSGVRNFYSNLLEVPTLVNSALQLKAERVMNSTARLLFNTIFGVGGLWDPASAMGLPKWREDFGQTLGHYGVPAGPYLMLPLIGPSSVRDSSGRIADYGLERYVNYLNYADTASDHASLTLLQSIDTRANTPFRYGQFSSPFEYDKLRFLYTEMRKLQVAD